MDDYNEIISNLDSKSQKHGAMDDNLILVEESSGFDFSSKQCKLCTKYISVPYYYYTSQEESSGIEEVYLHKACSDLPREMEHELHSGHTLLLRCVDNEGGVVQFCNICNDRCIICSFNCSDCEEFVTCVSCALKLFPVSHKCHQHPLIPVHYAYESFECVACKRHRDGISYKCATCPFRVHQECVSSRIVKLRSHCHELQLIYSLPENRLIYCEICGKDMKDQNYAYHCARCSYFVHIYNCRAIKHFCHDHPLDTVEEGDEYGGYSPLTERCYGCGLDIALPYYTCTNRYCSRSLHKSCAELPHNVEHVLHPGHALTISTVGKSDKSESDEPEYDETESICSACCIPWKGFSYSCSDASCFFMIDILCAMKSLHLKREFHEHPLFSSLSKGSSPCHACNKTTNSITYECTICRFWVHQTCASLPMFKRIKVHPHKLKLTYSLPENRQFLRCQICRQEIEPNGWVYQCAGCKFFTHVHSCSFRSREPRHEIDYKQLLPVAARLPVANEFVSLATLFFMDTKKAEHREENGIQTRMIPFLDPDGMCHVCAELLAGPCNNCDLCKCILPSGLQYPSLLEGLYSILKEEVNCKGFIMGVFEDEIIIEISSSVLPRYLKHEGHDHVLFTRYIEKKTWCNACENEFKGYGFVCNICDFTIDTYCALLPGSITHRYDKKHPFKLTYYSVENVEEYVCDICEGDITTMWFYHCEECDHSIHPTCIWKIQVFFGPFAIGGSSKNYQLNVVPTNLTFGSHCSICDAQETSGCNYSLFYGHGSDILHLQCLFNRGVKM